MTKPSILSSALPRAFSRDVRDLELTESALALLEAATAGAQTHERTPTEGDFLDLPPSQQAYSISVSEIDPILFGTAGHTAAIAFPVLQNMVTSRLISGQTALELYARYIDVAVHIAQTYYAEAWARGHHVTTTLLSPILASCVAYALTRNTATAERAAIAYTRFDSSPTFGTPAKHHAVARSIPIPEHSVVSPYPCASSHAENSTWQSLLENTYGAPTRYPFRDSILANSPHHSKAAPMCGYLEPLVWTLQSTQISDADVVGVRAKVPGYILEHSKYSRPKTHMEAQFSAPYIISCALQQTATLVGYFDPDNWNHGPPIAILPVTLEIASSALQQSLVLDTRTDMRISLPLTESPTWPSHAIRKSRLRSKAYPLLSDSRLDWLVDQI